MTPNWYLVKPKALNENRVFTRLPGAGYEVLFPRYRKKARRHRGMLGLDETSAADAMRFLASLDELANRISASTLIAVHHHGHSAERARGSSALQGWGDGYWTLKREGDDRLLSARGRDFEHADLLLQFDPLTRSLIAGDEESRENSKHDARLERLLGDVLDYLRPFGEPCTAKEVVMGIGRRPADVADALRISIARGLTEQSKEGRRLVYAPKE